MVVGAERFGLVEADDHVALGNIDSLFNHVGGEQDVDGFELERFQREALTSCDKISGLFPRFKKHG